MFKKIISYVIVAVMLITCFTSVSAVNAEEFKLPDLISDNMLIQRDMPIKLWGYGGNYGTTLVVSFEDASGTVVNSAETKIGNDGFDI